MALPFDHFHDTESLASVALSFRTSGDLPGSLGSRQPGNGAGAQGTGSTSQASPMRSPSASVCVGFGVSGQLSSSSGTPSPSPSDAVVTAVTSWVSQVVPLGQSLPARQLPGTRRMQRWQSASVAHAIEVWRAHVPKPTSQRSSSQNSPCTHSLPPGVQPPPSQRPASTRAIVLVSTSLVASSGERSSTGPITVTTLPQKS